MSKAQHTPTPWELFPTDKLEVVAPSGRGTDRIKVADCYHYNGEANAAHIVKCVNLHDELVSGLQLAKALIQATYKNNNIEHPACYFEAIAKYDELLAKARSAGEA